MVFFGAIKIEWIPLSKQRIKRRVKKNLKAYRKKAKQRGSDK